MIRQDFKGYRWELEMLSLWMEGFSSFIRVKFYRNSIFRNLNISLLSQTQGDESATGCPINMGTIYNILEATFRKAHQTHSMIYTLFGLIINDQKSKTIFESSLIFYVYWDTLNTVHSRVGGGGGVQYLCFFIFVRNKLLKSESGNPGNLTSFPV